MMLKQDINYQVENCRSCVDKINVQRLAGTPTFAWANTVTLMCMVFELIVILITMVLGIYGSKPTEPEGKVVYIDIHPQQPQYECYTFYVIGYSYAFTFLLWQLTFKLSKSKMKALWKSLLCMSIASQLSSTVDTQYRRYIQLDAAKEMLPKKC